MTKFDFILILTFWTCLSSSSFAAKKYSLYYGAGVQADDTNHEIFNRSFENYSRSMQTKNWNYNTYFDGEHADLQAKAAQLTGGINKKFDSGGYNRSLQGLFKQIMDGKIQKGDQLLLAVDTHGLQQSGATHHITTTDGTVSLDLLKSIRDAAEMKGVKLAIIDSSCYSGNSMALASEKTCVITTSTADTLSYTPDADLLFDKLSKSKNLEEAYLNARIEAKGSYSTPMISSETGKQLSKSLDITNYPGRVEMNMRDGKNIPWACDPNKMKKQLEELKSFANQVGGSKVHPEIKELEAKLLTFENTRKSLALTGKQLEEETACAAIEGNRLCVPVKNFDLKDFETAVDRRIKQLNTDLKTADDIGKIALKDELAGLKRDKAFAEAIKKDPNSRAALELKKQYDQLRVELYPKTSQVMALEKKLYDKLYRKMAASEQQSNPCRDFKL